MNILQAYIKKYNQIIILILGLPCTNKSEIAKELGIDLNFQVIKINDFLIKDKYKEINIDGIKTKVYEDPDNYNWDELNSKINELKINGVIIYGNYLDIEKIDWEIDFSFFYSMNIKTCKKILFEKKMIEWEESDTKLDSDSILNKYFEKFLNPLYEDIKNTIKINRFFNIKDETKFDESYDDIFKTLMELISKKLK
jgi:hypothetical protein